MYTLKTVRYHAYLPFLNVVNKSQDVIFMAAFHFNQETIKERGKYYLKSESAVSRQLNKVEKHTVQ